MNLSSFTSSAQRCPYCSSHRLCVDNSKCRTCVSKTIAGTDKLNLFSTKNEITASQALKSSANKVWWKCEGGCEDFLATPANVIGLGSGCPSCKFKTEKKLEKWLVANFPDTKRQFTLEELTNNGRCLPFDFVLPSLKTLVELDGDQHFVQVSNWKSPETTRKRDIYKMNYAESQGFKIIRIYQMDVYKNGEDWLDKYVLPSIIDFDRSPVFISSNETIYDNHIQAYQTSFL